MSVLARYVCCDSTLFFTSDLLFCSYKQLVVIIHDWECKLITKIQSFTSLFTKRSWKWKSFLRNCCLVAGCSNIFRYYSSTSEDVSGLHAQGCFLKCSFIKQAHSSFGSVILVFTGGAFSILIYCRVWYRVSEIMLRQGWDALFEKACEIL